MVGRQRSGVAGSWTRSGETELAFGGKGRARDGEAKMSMFRLPRMGGPRARRYGRHKAIAILVTFAAVWIVVRFLLPDRAIVDKLEKWANPLPGPEEAFRERLSGVLVEAPAVIEKVLPDTTLSVGAGPTQRFVARTPAGHPFTVFRDLAAAPSLAVGDTLTLRGTYAWDPRGGVLRSPPSGKSD